MLIGVTLRYGVEAMGLLYGAAIVLAVGVFINLVDAAHTEMSGSYALLTILACGGLISGVVFVMLLLGGLFASSGPPSSRVQGAEMLSASLWFLPISLGCFVLLGYIERRSR